jgi:2-iminobutanoate/2-iminopropanoate deaminase
MAFKFISTSDAPKAVGPYSQAVRAGNMLFLSGQIPIDPKTNELNLFEGDVARQTGLVLNNLKAVLAAEGLELKDVAKTTVFLKSMADFAKMNEVYSMHFGDHRPARACVAVAELPKGASVEIDAVAWVG